MYFLVKADHQRGRTNRPHIREGSKTSHRVQEQRCTSRFCLTSVLTKNVNNEVLIISLKNLTFVYSQVQHFLVQSPQHRRMPRGPTAAKPPPKEPVCTVWNPFCVRC